MNYQEFIPVVAICGEVGVGKKGIIFKVCDFQADCEFLRNDYDFQPTIEDGRFGYVNSMQLYGRTWHLRFIESVYLDSKSVDAVVFVFSKGDSFERLKEKKALINSVKSSSKAVILVCSKTDLHVENPNFEEEESFAKEIGCPFLSCSAKSGENMHLLKELIFIQTLSYFDASFVGSHFMVP